MNKFLNKLNPVQCATVTWCCLMMATICAAVLSQFFSSGLTLLFLSVAILILKGQLIVDSFMGLRNVARHWRFIMSAYCIVIGMFVITAYLIGVFINTI